MMPLYSIFDIAGSAMSAQTVRLNTTASNLANAESVSGTEEGAYRARQPIFATVMDAATMQSQGVRVAGIVESPAAVVRKYEPANPLADEQGNVYMPNVNVIEDDDKNGIGVAIIPECDRHIEHLKISDFGVRPGSWWAKCVFELS